MGATILIAAWLTVVIVWMAYDYSRFRGKVSETSERAKVLENELAKIQEHTQNLQTTNQDLQNRLNIALVDSVTNLLGWHLFEDRLNQTIKESRRYQFTLAVMFIDIDEFKIINNALGYELGDQLLRSVAQRLQNCIRQVDSLSRMAKDTFVLMLPQLGKPEMAAIVAQRILQAIAQPFNINGNDLYVSVSIGIAIFPHDQTEMTGLFKSAEQALGMAKSKGKHSYQFYQERMNVNSQRELQLANGLRRDNIHHELMIYYQPIINTETQAILAMEALLYWRHPELNMIEPNELQNFALKQGKSNFLFEWLLNNACRQYLYWRTLGFTPQYLMLPIHIKQFENTNFIYRISQILQELDFKPECLLLQVDTGGMPIAFENLEKGMNIFNYMGIKLCINNFGCGFFSLRELKEHKVHFLKLDSQLITDWENPETITLLKAIVRLATDLKIQVIIPQVDSAELATQLKALDCGLLQGKFLGAPISEKEVPHHMLAVP